MQERSLISLFFNPANCVISVIWVTIFWMTLNEGIYHQKYAYNPERCFPPIQMRKLSIIWWHLKGVYTLFCKNNFIRTKALILVKKLGTSYEQSQVCCTIEHKNRVSRLAIFRIKKKHQDRARLPLILHQELTSLNVSITKFCDFYLFQYIHWNRAGTFD